MDARYIAFAVPLFFLAIAVELGVGALRGQRLYRFHDAVNSLSCGIGQQALAVFVTVVSVGAYSLVYDHLRVATVPATSVVAWVVLLFALDLGYWTYHWASHRVNFLWAMHAVHHQSEEYNLSTALRQSWFTSLVSWVFYAPLAIAGFPPAMFVTMLTLNILYQFWIHTRVVGRLGFLEWFLNTPSHHRVHHGIDPLYIDRNYAGIFILWDRLFGTFQREEREPAYGTVKPLASWNPLWANLERWAELGQMARQTKRLRDKIHVFLAPPEWRPADLGGPVTVPEVDHEARRLYAFEAPVGLNVYVALQLLLVVAAMTALLWYQESTAPGLRAGIVGVVVVSLVAWGGLVEAKAWALPLEGLRLTAVAALASWMARGTSAATAVTVAAMVTAIAMVVWVARYRGRTVTSAASRAGSTATLASS